MSNKTTKTTTKKTSTKKVVSKKANANEKLAFDKQSPANGLSVKQVDRTTEKKATPVAFSMSDIESLIQKRKKTSKTESTTKPAKKTAPTKKKQSVVEENVVEKRVLGAASLSDILGFNPAEKESIHSIEEESIPKKWKKYYKLLIELRKHFSDELDLHTSDTLQHNSRDDIGDRTLEDDAGSDAFDRDFALSLVSNEQEALNEIEEAIGRIKKATYGVCEVTGRPIDKERLTAVPFTRYSVEGQIEFEKNSRRKNERKMDGLFTDSAENPKITSNEDEDDS